MVFPGLGEETGRVPAAKSMAMGPERSKPLHNFMLPCLKWGNQKYLRCMKVGADGAEASTSGDRRSLASKSGSSTVTPRKRELEPEKKQPANARDSEKRMRMSKSQIQGDREDGIEAMREKLMLDLKTAADRMKDAILRKEAVEENEEEVAVEEEEHESAPPQTAAAAAAGVWPWNLRTRRAACKAPIAGDSGKGSLKMEDKKHNNSPLKTDAAVKSPKLRGTSDKAEKVKFSLPLTRKEIEADFMEMLGHRPPRRPKKRPRIVQKQLDSLFPGLWLSEVTADSYKVPESPENGKR